jgi:predicted carbohydrate-binding protein with CBM5 and CBM33 domain
LAKRTEEDITKTKTKNQRKMQLPIPFLSLLGFATLATSHGLVQTPQTRQPGAATAAACGQTMVTFYKADNTSYPEALMRANPSGLKDGYDAAKCNLYLCKGFQFADNTAQVQTYKPGDVVDMQVWIRIAHKGHANVSVVDTKSNSVIGTPLIAWADNYAATTSPPADQTKFSVKVPELGGKCTVAGDCVSFFFFFFLFPSPFLCSFLLFLF